MKAPFQVFRYLPHGARTTCFWWTGSQLRSNHREEWSKDLFFCLVSKSLWCFEWIPLLSEWYKWISYIEWDMIDIQQLTENLFLDLFRQGMFITIFDISFIYIYWLYMYIIHICQKVFKPGASYLKTLSNHTPVFYWARWPVNVNGMS